MSMTNCIQIDRLDLNMVVTTRRRGEINGLIPLLNHLKIQGPLPRAFAIEDGLLTHRELQHFSEQMSALLEIKTLVIVVRSTFETRRTNVLLYEQSIVCASVQWGTGDAERLAQ